MSRAPTAAIALCSAFKKKKLKKDKRGGKKKENHNVTEGCE